MGLFKMFTKMFDGKEKSLNDLSIQYIELDRISKSISVQMKELKAQIIARFSEEELRTLNLSIDDDNFMLTSYERKTDQFDTARFLKEASEELQTLFRKTTVDVAKFKKMNLMIYQQFIKSTSVTQNLKLTKKR